MDPWAFIRVGLLLSLIIIIIGCDRYTIRPNAKYWNNPVGECPYRDSPSPECRDGKGFLLSIELGEIR